MIKKKKVGTQPVFENNYYCDFDNKKKAYNHLKLTGWYGSDIDMKEYDFDLSNEALKEIMDFIESKLHKTILQDHFKYYEL